jgi:hypothetical protein
MTVNLSNSKPEVAASDGASKQFRRLEANELVSRGDFVADPHSGFESWEGPTGFRADSFVKPIYRKQEVRLTGAKKLP